MHAVDPSKPSVARVYDYFLDGKDNYAADREAADKILAIEPEAAKVAHENRAFLGRVVRYLTAEVGIRQFLDIGTGIPTMENVHQIALKIAPRSRIVYVDNDDTVLVHARALLVDNRGEGACAYVDADLRDVDAVLSGAAGTLDFSQPIAVLLLGILHFIPSKDDPWAVVSRLVEAVPPGSYLAVSHAMSAALTADQQARLDAVYLGTNAKGVTQRSADEIARFFDGLEPVKPGLTGISAWRPEPGRDPHPTRQLFHGGVGRKLHLHYRQLQAWDSSTKQVEHAEAAVVRWACDQEPWTMVPDAAMLQVFDMPPAIFTQALNRLVGLGVLVKDGHEYFVAPNR